MKRIGEIAAILVIVCGWICAQEKPAGQARQKAVKVENPAAHQDKPVGAPETPAVQPEKADQPPKPERPSGGWWDDVFTERNVPLSKILASPEAWRDIPISFVVQFHQIGKSGPSFFTRFDPDAWLGFAAWADDAALWEKKAFETDFPNLFVRRDTADARVVSSAAIYDRLAVCAIVREVIKGRPWVEVTSIRKLAEKMSEGSLVHLVKALTLRDHRRFEAAAREFEAADADTLPVGVRLLGMREDAFALLNARKPKAAEEKLLAALSLDPENSETALALTHVREVMKDMPERTAVSRPVPAVAQPPPEDEEPVTPGPPDPLADKPKRSLRLPFPKANPADSRPAKSGR